MSNSNNRRYIAAAAALIVTTADGFVNPVSVTITSPKVAGRKAGFRRSLHFLDYSSSDKLDCDDASEKSTLLQPHKSSFPVGGEVDNVAMLENLPLSTTNVILPPATTPLDLEVTSLELESLLMNTQAQEDDLSKQILLESITRTRPEDVLAEAKASRSLMGRGSSISNATNMHPVETAVYDDSVNIAPPTFLEDVKAVLAFSEEAALQAEASMSPEIVEQLQLDVGRNASLATITTEHSFVGDDDGLKDFISATVPSTVLDQILPASQVVGEPITKPTTTTIEAPNVGKILKFAIPAIGVWLCGPLLSLIDTSAVGVFSGTIQQAALNPAVAVTDYAALLIAFMYTGTTNMVAAAQASDRETIDKPRTAKTMIGAMQMSTFVGAGLGVILFAFARPLLRAIIGNDAISPAVFAAAMKYVRIRALGMPAAAIIGSTQAACLGMQDIRSPLYVLVAAAVVNFFGDVFFVGNSHPLIGGAAGAAWATVISQYVAVAFFVRWLCTNPRRSRAQPQVLNVSDAILKMTGKPGETISTSSRQSLHDVIEALKMTNRRRKLQERMEKFADERKGKYIGRVLIKLFGLKTETTIPSGATKSDVFSVRGFLKNRFSPKDLLKVPNQETRQQFAPYVLPVTTTQVGKVSGYVAMSHVVASSLGTISMAAQQVIVSLFYCLCPIADSLSLTAQSFIPGIAEKKASMEKANAMRLVMRNFLKAGAVFGGVMMAAVTGIPLLSGFFTSDPAVISLVNSVVPLLLVFFGTHGFMCATEGVLLGQKDLGFVGKMYAIFFGAVPFLMMRVKRAALTGSRPVDLSSVWNVFVGYQVFRSVVWLVRSSMLQRRSDREAAGKAIPNDDSIAP